MPFVSTNQFGVSVATMKANYMAWLKSSDDTVLGNAIDVVSADVCRMLTTIGVYPPAITQALYPNDFVNLGDLVSIGVLARYGMATASNREQAVRWSEDYGRRFEMMRKNPAEWLQAYQQVDGVNTVRSHTDDLTANQLQASRGLFWDPLNRINSWTR